ncbi:progestin and adipoQ receptor family member 3-like isoform X1 [Littorina saxatilis]|uniref:Progestin and adipoQ receptor family member 3 n=1 Tax=Littorina saxatilis TaxID=31220 RepID=A0AAN9GLL4_9CAEN
MYSKTADTVKNRQVSNTRQQSGASDPYHILDIEIDDHGAAVCRTGICKTSPEEIRLFSYNEIPEFLKGNPWVVDGYRAFLPFGLCMKSLFVWSNETLNIWSHLVGFLLFLVLMLYDNLIAIPRLRGGLTDHVVITLGLLCYQFCMICSTGFHIFCCHSERASRRWLQVDMTGVSIGLIGCYLPAVHYAFYCLSIWRDIYMMIITVLTVSTLWFQLHPHFFTSRWFHTRMAVYVGLAAYGIMPSVHWVYLNGGFSAPVVQMFIPKVTAMYMLGLLAFIFYISKFPERMFPGLFDYIGSSHQLWHTIIVFAFVFWHHSGREILFYRLTHTCPV